MNTRLHRRKMAAPIIISSILAVYYAGFALLCILFPGLPLAFKLFGGIVPLLLAGVSIAVCVERIKEIRSGEEDDLSKY